MPSHCSIAARWSPWQLACGEIRCLAPMCDLPHVHLREREVRRVVGDASDRDGIEILRVTLRGLQALTSFAAAALEIGQARCTSVERPGKGFRHANRLVPCALADIDELLRLSIEKPCTPFATAAAIGRRSGIPREQRLSQHFGVHRTAVEAVAAGEKVAVPTILRRQPDLDANGAGRARGDSASDATERGQLGP